MKINTLTLSDSDYPDVLRQLAQPPRQLYYLGVAPKELLSRPTLAIVGSRKLTPYGRQVTERFASEAADYGIVVVSGLAIGVDGVAHQATVAAGGQSIAVLPCGLDHIYPASHHQLAKDILAKDGCLITEYGEGTEPFPVNFIARNRIIAGLSQVLLVTEAAEKSGSLYTANFALEQGKDVLAVPGNINSPTSVGTNNLIKAGATPVTDARDVVRALGIDETARVAVPEATTAEEQLILMVLAKGTQDTDTLLKTTRLSVDNFNQTLTMLEITGRIRAAGSGQWTLS